MAGRVRIDNIFTNNIAEVSLSMQGLPVTDVPGHNQIFNINWELLLKENFVYMYKTVFDSSEKDTFHSALSPTD